MKLNLLLLCTDEVQDDATTWQTWQSCVAEPFIVATALHDTCWVMDSTIPASPIWQVCWIKGGVEVLRHVIKIIKFELCSGLVQQGHHRLLILRSPWHVRRLRLRRSMSALGALK